MKQKFILGFSLLLLIGVIVLISRDLFKSGSSNEENANEYDLEKLRKIDSTLLCYREINQFRINLGSVNSLAIDDELNVYVLGDYQLQVYNKAWKKIIAFNVDSSAHCLAIDRNKLIYIGVDNHVEVYDLKGSKISSWESYSTDGYLTSLVTIDGNLYAADAESKVVLRYDLAGKLINTIGQKDKARGIEGFIIPSMYFDVAAGPYKELWISNPGRHLLQNFTSEGELLSSWGTASMQIDGFAGCCNPVHFIILPDGSFVTYEKGLDRIKVYNPTGKFLCVVAGPSKIDKNSLNTCSVRSPVHDMVCDKYGTVYVLDGEAKLIRVFEKIK
jgi:hypothetical protein